MYSNTLTLRNDITAFWNLKHGGAQGIHIPQKGHESGQISYTETCLMLWDWSWATDGSRLR